MIAEEKTQDRTLRKRWRNASLIVMAAFIMVALSGMQLPQEMYPASDMSHTEIRLSWEQLWTEETRADDRDTLPSDFIYEAFSLEGFSQVRTSNDGSIIGGQTIEKVETAFERYSQILKDKGWTQVASGHENVATFAKKNGKYSWLALQCLRVGDETSVVIQVH